MNRSSTIAVISSTVAIVAVTTLIVERVRAAGIPATAALTYTGYLESPDGTPVTASKGINLYMYDVPTAGEPVCQVVPPAPIAVAAGRFQIALPDKCTEQVKVKPDLYIDIQVDGLFLGRTKLGAVPYAVEAGHAVAAESATNATNAAHATAADSATIATTAAKATTADGLRGVALGAAAPAAGQLLHYDGTQWAPFEIGWALMHSAASSACLALSPVGDSGWAHIVLPRATDTSCSTQCAGNAAGYTKCRAAVAVGSLRSTQATTNSDVVGWNYNYPCDNVNNGGDEARGQGLSEAGGTYAAYCCCYH